jgi:hypothetical protein
MAFPHGERLELTTIESAPSRVERLDKGANRAIAVAKSLGHIADA